MESADEKIAQEEVALPVSKQSTEGDPNCTHNFIIESPIVPTDITEALKGRRSWGRCRNCGATRTFATSLEGATLEKYKGKKIFDLWYRR